MRIALWTLRLAAVLPAIMASVVMLPDFADHTGPSMVPFLPAILVAYAWGLAIGLLRAQPEEGASPRAWIALVPLACQFAIYVSYWAVRVAGLASEDGIEPSTALGLFASLSFVAFLLGFPAALVSGLAFRRVRPLIVVEALGPVLLFLTVGLGASVEAMGQ